jgi:signal transduction histidine kinase
MTDLNAHLTPEVLVPRLGEYLVKRGIISDAQLKQALAYQKDAASRGEARLLGQALLDLHFVDRPTLDTAVTEQIIQLRSALEDANRHLEARVEQRTAELQEALRRLSELSQMKANFVSNVSHELRTPLTHIKGYLELLVSEALGDVTPEQKQALEVSQHAADRLQNLIDDLIMFSLASRGELSIQMRPFDLLNTLASVLRDHQDKADERHIQLEVNLPRDLPPVNGDAPKIAWVISQLLDNAIKFTPEHGTITLAAAREKDHMLVLSVADTGIGIPEERREEIFEPFHQLDGSATRRYGGTGLGLSLVRQIVEAHGSILDVHSNSNNIGVTFSFPLLLEGA